VRTRGRRAEPEEARERALGAAGRPLVRELQAQVAHLALAEIDREGLDHHLGMDGEGSDQLLDLGEQAHVPEGEDAVRAGVHGEGEVLLAPVARRDGTDYRIRVGKARALLPSTSSTWMGPPDLRRASIERSVGGWAYCSS